MCKMCKNCTFFYEDFSEMNFKRYICAVMDYYVTPDYCCTVYQEKVRLNEDVKAE